MFHTLCAKQQSHWLVGIGLQTSLSKWRAPLRLHWFRYLLLNEQMIGRSLGPLLLCSKPHFCPSAFKHRKGWWILWGLFVSVRHETSDEWIQDFSCPRNRAVAVVAASVC